MVYWKVIKSILQTVLFYIHTMDMKDFERVLKVVLHIYDRRKSEHDNIPTLFPF